MLEAHFGFFMPAHFELTAIFLGFRGTTVFCCPTVALDDLLALLFAVWLLLMEVEALIFLPGLSMPSC